MELDKLFYNIRILTCCNTSLDFVLLMNQSYLGDFFSHTMALAGHLYHTDTFLVIICLELTRFLKIIILFYDECK